MLSVIRTEVARKDIDPEVFETGIDIIKVRHLRSTSRSQPHSKYFKIHTSKVLFPAHNDYDLQLPMSKNNVSRHSLPTRLNWAEAVTRFDKLYHCRSQQTQYHLMQDSGRYSFITRVYEACSAVLFLLMRTCGN